MDKDIIKVERNTFRVCPFRSVTVTSQKADLTGAPIVTQNIDFPECYYASCYYYDKECCTRVEATLK